MKDDRLYLIHILECVERIDEYVVDGETAFNEDRKTQDAVLRNLHTLSESTQRLSDDLRNRHSQIDWKAIAGFRNVIVHDYLGVNLRRVWEIVSKYLPELKTEVESMLEEINGKSV
jgi:uncharacterized protein with HEPN domain